MKTVFADSYYFLAVGNDRDQGHLRAAEYASSFHGRIVTTEWVLTEVGDALSALEQRPQFLSLMGLIRSGKNSVVVDASHDLFERGVELFARRLDKAWSLTDCISFLVMEEHGLAEALTADHHFQQAGFVPLLV